MLSGEATSADITEAYDSVFSKHVHKNNVLSELPRAVVNLLIRYASDIAIEAARVVDFSVRLRSRPWPRGSVIDYKLLQLDSLEYDFCFDEDWRTKYQVDAGVSLKTTVEVGVNIERNREKDIRESFSSKAGVSGATMLKLQSLLMSEVAKHEKVSVRKAFNEKVTREVNLALPAEPINPSDLHVKTRLYQVAPLYVRAIAVVVSTCSCCSMSEVNRIQFLRQRPAFKTRHMDTYSDGTVNVIETGVITNSVLAD
jgi:hypothetical protein